MANEPTLQDVLAAVKEVGEAVQALATHMDDELAKVRGDVKEDFARVRAEMATKDFVDRRVGDVEAKIGVLVDVLEDKQVITPKEA